MGRPALAKLTAPGPLVADHETVTLPPAGRPSSPTVPESVVPTVAIALIDAGVTTGAWLPGSPRNSTSSLVVSMPSVAVSRRTYVAVDVERPAVVAGAEIGEPRQPGR